MYNILPFQFSRFSESEVLLVNECGDYYFIDYFLFDSFVRHKLDEKSTVFFDLKSKLFLYQDSQNSVIEKISAKYRSKKAFLRDFTSLHMLVVTLRCNQKCRYCQVSCAEEDAHKYDMNMTVAERSVDIILKSPSKDIKIEFQGGEPLLNWEIVKHTIQYAQEKSIHLSKKISFVLCTNLTLITKEHLLFLREHGAYVSTSLDGPQCLHDSCRKLRSQSGTYRQFVEKLALTRDIIGNDKVNALMTTTAFSIDNLPVVVDEYIKMGMDGIFIRSLNPYGFAAEQAETVGYDMERFVESYLSALRYILAKNKEIYFPEYFSTLLLSRILTPFSTGFVDLQSPAGAGISGAIYDYDGSVFPADEARMLAQMGDRHFCLGNVMKNSFEQIFSGSKLREITSRACVETTPPCAWCVYQAYCGTDPVRNYLESGQELRNMVNSPFCIKHKGIFDGLFHIIRENDEAQNSILWSWITRNPNWVIRDAHI